ncbi:unnamed protein product [Clonostachys rosea f. rosea IK726]|uniref:Uncharacterized protein n=1 Tax=Clonostachys rosea f. rosea IK726 TaxID=1349383 RepID=A0ACA9UHC5_BIOOC|nr:unnamed protein product [Clonostachys rosea f. rosea IK726]
MPLQTQTRMIATILGVALAAQAAMFVLWSRRTLPGKENEENKENVLRRPTVNIRRFLMHYDVYHREKRAAGHGEAL